VDRVRTGRVVGLYVSRFGLSLTRACGVYVVAGFATGLKQSFFFKQIKIGLCYYSYWAGQRRPRLQMSVFVAYSIYIYSIRVEPSQERQPQKFKRKGENKRKIISQRRPTTLEP
jgi:hypothetical protein